MFVNTTRPALFVMPACSDPLTATRAEGSGLPWRSVTSTLTVVVARMAGVVSVAGATADASRNRQSEEIMGTPLPASSCEAGATAARPPKVRGPCDESAQRAQPCNPALPLRQLGRATGKRDTTKIASTGDSPVTVT